MSWCPNCKTEYQAGITTCADCGAELITSTENTTIGRNTYELALFKEEALAKRLVQYLEYSGIQYTDINVDSESECFHVLVDIADKKAAIKHYNAFLSVESELTDQGEVASSSDDFYEPELSNDDEEIKIMDAYRDLENEEMSADATTDQDHPKSAFITKEAAFKEQRSSAIMFFVFSIAGLLFVGLNIAGIIQFINGILSYTVMSGLFLGFLFLGFYSLRKSKEFAAGIDTEKELMTKMNAYLDEIDISSIDEASWSELSEEVLFFKRNSKLKDLLLAQFGNIDDDFLDYVIEEYYDNHLS